MDNDVNMEVINEPDEQNVVKIDGETIVLVTTNNVKEALHNVGIYMEDADSIQTLTNYCLVFNIDAHNMAEKWYGFTMKNPKVGLVPTKGYMDIFKENFLTKAYIADHNIPSKRVNVEYGGDTGKSDADCYTVTEVDVDEEILSKLPKIEVDDNMSQEDRDALLAQRVSMTFGIERSETDFHVLGDFQTVIVSPVNPEAHFTKPVPLLKFRQFEFTELMNSEVEDMEKVFLEKGYQLNSLTSLSSSPAYYVGRIIKDPANQGRKFSSDTIVLEGSQFDRVALNFSRLLDAEDESSNIDDKNKFSVFPGQLICIEADKPDRLKEELSVISVVEPPPMMNRLIPALKTMDPLQVVIVVGPLRVKGSSYHDKLYQYLRTAKPHVIILVGPIVDSRDSEDILRPGNNQDLAKMTKILSLCSPSSKIIVIPSPFDYFSYNVTPSAPFDMTPPSPEILLYPNPSFFRVGDISFAVSSTDIIRHLLKEEISNISGERIKRMVGHILRQRNVYPLLPPELDTNIDYSYARHLKMPEKPDILILPSDVKWKNFATVIDGTLCLNPDKLSRGCITRLRIDTSSAKPLVENICGQIIAL